MKKKARLVVIVLTVLTACGHEDSGGKGTETVAAIPEIGESDQPQQKDGTDGRNGSSCSTKDTEEGAEIICEDGSKATVKDGKDGKSVTGAQGPAGADAEPLPLNQWFDPLTSKHWLITTSQPWTSGACGNWSWPTVTEMRDAIDHGIFLASADIGGPATDAWTGEAGITGHIVINSSFPNGGNDLDSQLHGVFCVK